MRYYSTQRPVGPGTFPQQEWNKVLEIHKEYIENVGDRCAVRLEKHREKIEEVA